MQSRFIIVLLLFTSVFYSQSNNTIVSKITIKSNFSMQSIKAYQESAVYKIKDYYNYLEVYSNSKTSDSLKNHVKKAIYTLFESKNIDVVDITTSEKYCVKMVKLFEKVANKNYKFKLTDFESSIAVEDFWTTKYYLQVIENDEICNIEVFTKVVFKPVQKKFGSKTKEVWTLFLGEME